MKGPSTQISGALFQPGHWVGRCKPGVPLASSGSPQLRETACHGALCCVLQAVEEARAWQDTDYVDYASQHFPTLDALEQWLDHCRKVYYPWMQRMQRVNANYARRAAITGVCAEIERRREAELERVLDITIQEVPTFAYDTRCGLPAPAGSSTTEAPLQTP